MIHKCFQFPLVLWSDTKQRYISRVKLEVQDITSSFPDRWVHVDGASHHTSTVGSREMWAFQTGWRWSLSEPRHARGMETVPLARLRLRVWVLDSVSSSPCSSDFLSAIVARKRRVTESHSSGNSMSRKPRQMMQVAASRTTLKITSCFKTSTARERRKDRREQKREPESRVGKEGAKGGGETQSNWD